MINIFRIIIIMIVAISFHGPSCEAAGVRFFKTLVGDVLYSLDSVDGDGIDAGDPAYTLTSAGLRYSHYFVASGSCAANDSPYTVYPASCSTDDAGDKGYWKLSEALYQHPTATPSIYGLDSDYADDPVIQIIGNSIDGTDGEVIFKGQLSNALVTYLRWNGTDEQLEMPYDLFVTGTLRNKTRRYIVTGTTVTSDAYSGTHYVLTADGAHLTLPACDSGAIGVCYEVTNLNESQTGEIGLTDSGDAFILNEIAVLTANNELHSSATNFADYIKLCCLIEDYWIAGPNIGWEDGGAP